MVKFKLTPQQKDEIRRLTQLANRRIKAFEKEYKKEGLEILPYGPTGGIQTRAQWETKNYPLSRSVVFGSEKDYKQRLAFLKSFADPSPAGRPTVTQYKEVQQMKLSRAITTALGDTPDSLQSRINSMSPAQISKFWNEFSERASRLGLQYSSSAIMEELLDIYEEDIDYVVGG